MLTKPRLGWTSSGTLTEFAEAPTTKNNFIAPARADHDDVLVTVARVKLSGQSLVSFVAHVNHSLKSDLVSVDLLSAEEVAPSDISARMSCNGSTSPSVFSVKQQ